MGGQNSGRKSTQDRTDIQNQIANGHYHPEEISTDLEGAADVQPGGPDKLEILAARQAAGLPLWNTHDRTALCEGSELIGNRGDEHLARRYGVQGTGRPKKKRGGE